MHMIKKSGEGANL